MKTLYAVAAPYAVHRIETDHGHRLHVEECGNPRGLPVLFLHGGPGSGCRPHHRGFFDPERYRAILPDQRGAGRSTPLGRLEGNTTTHLLRDLETIRKELGIERWLLFGGSWGATLALLYAQAHPDRCLGLILRGTFLARAQDIGWFVGHGANRIYPEAWQQFLDFLPADEREAPIAYLYNELTGTDELAQRRAARAWLRWGDVVTLGNAFAPAVADNHIPQEQVNKARIELHYANHDYFLRSNQILDGCRTIAHLPCTLVHGRSDLVCPPEAAHSLHQALPGSVLHIVPGGGHIAEGDAMIDALVDAVDRFAEGFVQ